VSAEESAAAGVKLAQARLAEARLNLSYTTVSAPVSGFASRAQRSEGSLVSPGADSLLTTVSQIDPLHVNFSVSENEKLRFDKLVAEGRLVLPAPKKGALEVTLRLADGSVFPRKGKLSFVDARINPATGSFDARAEIANPDGALHPGQFVRVQLNGAAPLENAINGVEGMLYMSSNSSSNGIVQIQVTFEIGTDVDQAALAVNNRVKQAESLLPQKVRRQGVTVEKGSSSFLQVIAFFSPDARFDDLYTSNYVTLNVLDELKRIPGTTNVQIFGAKDYAMRIRVRPDRLAQLRLTTGDIARAINEQNAQFAAERERIAALRDRQAALADLCKALGGGWSAQALAHWR
jgi:hypothetical protein